MSASKTNKYIRGKSGKMVKAGTGRTKEYYAKHRDRSAARRRNIARVLDVSATEDDSQGLDLVRIIREKWQPKLRAWFEYGTSRARARSKGVGRRDKKGSVDGDAGRLLGDVKSENRGAFLFGGCAGNSTITVKTRGEPCPPAVQAYLREYFQLRPFDLIRFGLLKILPKNSPHLIWYEPWEEQLEMLDYVEHCWYNRRPIFMHILKARQIGASTFFDAVQMCLLITNSHFKGHLVADLESKAKYHAAVIRTFYRNLPDWLKPEIARETTPMLWDDPEFGIEESTLDIESAERGEKIGRGPTYFFNHFSEVAFWKPTVITEVLAALENQIGLGWPFVEIKESTGRSRADSFAHDYFMAKEGHKKPWKTFFFPWFNHRDYRIPLDDGLDVDEWIANLSDQDAEMMRTYNLEPAQVNCYIQMREKALTGEKAGTIDLFRREFPCNEEEAFLGGGSTFFDGAHVKTDISRCSDINRTRYTEEMLQESTTPLDRTAVSKRLGRWRCSIDPDRLFRYSNPKLLSIDEHKATLNVWEKPRTGHSYVVTLDPAEGKLAIKNVRTTGDYLVVDVWRYTYEPWEQNAIVQVAQFRMQGVDPREGASVAVALSVLYRDVHSEKALLVIERNSSGLAAVEEAKDGDANQYYRVFRDKDGIEIGREIGFTTTGGEQTKNAALTLLRQAWNAGYIVVNSLETASEFGTFTQNDKGKLEAIPPWHDDTITTAFLAVEGIRYLNQVVAPVPIIVRQQEQPSEDEFDMILVKKLKLPKHLRKYQDKESEVETAYGI